MTAVPIPVDYRRCFDCPWCCDTGVVMLFMGVSTGRECTCRTGVRRRELRAYRAEDAA